MENWLIINLQRIFDTYSLIRVFISLSSIYQVPTEDEMHKKGKNTIISHQQSE